MADSPKHQQSDPHVLIDAAFERLLSALKRFNAAHTEAVRQGRVTADTTVILQSITAGINGLMDQSAKLQRSLKPEPSRPTAAPADALAVRRMP